MKYRLEMLNQVQYADDEIRKKKLEAKGFHVVSTRAGTSGGAGIGEGSAEEVSPAEKPEETVKAVKKASKGSRKPATEKNPATEENPEDAGTGREPEAAGGEDKDAG